MSPTQRSLAHLKALGHAAKILERWNAFAKVRQDVFGADLIGFKPGEPVLVIQATWKDLRRRSSSSTPCSPFAASVSTNPAR
jgi:hypothetical protein